MELKKLADLNMYTKFFDNASRMIVLGLAETGAGIQIPATMGRSPNSRNRVYVAEGDILKTEAADESKVENPELIIYNTMRSLFEDEIYKAHIISNGDQTDTTWEEFEDCGVGSTMFLAAMERRYCEPDAPIFTPRITGYQDARDIETAYLSILKPDPFAREEWIAAVKEHGLKKEDFKKKGISSAEVNEAFNKEIGDITGLNHREFPTIRQTFEMPLEPGFGYCLTTYNPGRENLSAFTGEPFLVPIKGDLDMITQSFWNALYLQYDRVSLGAKIFSDEKSYHIPEPINRYEKVEQGE